MKVLIVLFFTSAHVFSSGLQPVSCNELLKIVSTTQENLKKSCGSTIEDFEKSKQNLEILRLSDQAKADVSAGKCNLADPKSNYKNALTLGGKFYDDCMGEYSVLNVNINLSKKNCSLKIQDDLNVIQKKINNIREQFRPIFKKYKNSLDELKTKCDATTSH